MVARPDIGYASLWLGLILMLVDPRQLDAQTWVDSSAIVRSVVRHVKASAPGTVAVRHPYVLRGQQLEPVVSPALARLTAVAAESAGMPVMAGPPDTLCTGDRPHVPRHHRPARILMLRDLHIRVDSATVRSYVESEVTWCMTGSSVAEWTFKLVRQGRSWLVASMYVSTAW